MKEHEIAQMIEVFLPTTQTIFCFTRDRVDS